MVCSLDMMSVDVACLLNEMYVTMQLDVQTIRLRTSSRRFTSMSQPTLFLVWREEKGCMLNIKVTVVGVFSDNKERCCC